MIAKKQKTMTEKIVVQERDHELASRIVGTVFIIVGAILVGLGIYSFVTYKSEPELNEDLKIPVLRELSDFTNDKIVELSGNADGIDKVRIFINDILVDTVKVKNERFEYQWNIEDEGIYTISIDGLKGFPKQKRSNMSNATFLKVDWTAPSSNMSLDYPEETAEKSFTITGIIDPDTTLFVKRGTKSYEAVSDENGNVEVVVDLLDEGKNVFSLLLVDKAGNETAPDEKVRITYSPSADVNGDGTTDSEIPEASGNLLDAMEEVSGDRLMTFFGILALLCMSFTSIVLAGKYRKIS